MTTVGSPTNSETSGGVLELATMTIQNFQAWHARYSKAHPADDLICNDVTIYGLPQVVESGRVPLFEGSAEKMIACMVTKTMDLKGFSTFRLEARGTHEPSDVMQVDMDLSIQYFIGVNPVGEAIEAGRVLSPARNYSIKQSDADIRESVAVFTRLVEVLQGLENNAVDEQAEVVSVLDGEDC